MPQFKLLLKRSYIMPIFNYLSTKFITLNTIIMFNVYIYVSLEPILTFDYSCKIIDKASYY